MSEAHPLYGTFMSRLFSCICKRDEEDYGLLTSAKVSLFLFSPTSLLMYYLFQKRVLVQVGVKNSSLSAIQKALSREELAKHFRRRTRGAEETAAAIESLLLTLSAATHTVMD